MTIYQVDADSYFKNLEQYLKDFSDPKMGYSHSNSRKVCEDTMNQLIKKYKITNKDILSIGSNFGHEEYWFHKNGCTLTFVDIDEGDYIENYLKTIPNPTKKDQLTFFLGDAFDFLKNHSECQFDVIYFRSFFPDERRSATIQKEYQLNFYKKVINYFSNNIFHRDFFSNWPKTQFPYMDLIVDLAQQNLREGGLFVHQSYYAGVNVKRNPHYIDLIKTQLKNIGITLINVYCFKTWPHVTLTVGVMNKNSDIRPYLTEIKTNSELTAFHGRSPLSKDGCEIVYKIGDY